MRDGEKAPGYAGWYVLGTVVGVVPIAAGFQGLRYVEQGRVVLTGSDLVDASTVVVGTLVGVLVVVLLQVRSAKQAGLARTRARRGLWVWLVLGFLGLVTAAVTASVFVWDWMGPVLRKAVLVDLPVAVVPVLLAMGLVVCVLLSWHGVRVHRRVVAARATNLTPSQYWADLPPR